MGLLLGLGLAGLLVWAVRSDGYPDGKGPLDALPSGLGKPSGSPTRVKAPSTQIEYKTWTWPPQGDKQFHVAARADGKLGWVSYWVTRSNGARSFYAGWTPAQGDQVGLLRKDFGL